MSENGKRQQNKKSLVISIIVGLIILITLVLMPSFFVPELSTMTYEVETPSTHPTSSNSLRVNSEQGSTTEEIVGTEPEPKVTHIQIPDAVKAIYMTACVAGTPSFREDLVELVRETEINSIMIDIKDFTGTLSFPPRNENLKPAWEAAPCGTSKMRDFIKELHAEEIFVIGRITVFQDPFYTQIRPDWAVQKASDRSVWTDDKGLSFIEVGAREYWDYIIDIAEESYALGFDELNFDYVRFPSDGDMQNIYYPFSEERINADPDLGKALIVEEFFTYLDEHIRGDMIEPDVFKRPITSADLFGMVTTSQNDLNIGQILEKGLPYFDFIAPMVYPSHYPNNFNGYPDPDDYPHEVVEFAMTSGVERIEAMLVSTSTPVSVKEKVHPLQLRTWIQDFDYGGDYGPEEVRTQIQATYDSGLTSWMVWAPSNRYTRAALLNKSD